MHIRRTYCASGLMLALVGVFLLAVPNLSFGQDTNASLSGTVTDPSDAAIPGAKLTLTNTATGFQSNFVSDDLGPVFLPQSDPGQVRSARVGERLQDAGSEGHPTGGQPGVPPGHAPAGGADQRNRHRDRRYLTDQLSKARSLEGGVALKHCRAFPLTVSGAPRSSVAVAIMMPGVTSAGSGNAFNARINGGIITGDEAAGRRRHGHRRLHEPERHGQPADRLWHVARHHLRSQGADRELRCPVRRHRPRAS